MTQKRFTPERGQFFFFVKESVIDGFPDLEVRGEKFDPKNKIHLKMKKDSNCYLTENEAYESLL